MPTNYKTELEICVICEGSLYTDNNKSVLAKLFDLNGSLEVLHTPKRCSKKSFRTYFFGTKRKKIVHLIFPKWTRYSSQM